jgi:hypothetical protein
MTDNFVDVHRQAGRGASGQWKIDKSGVGSFVDVDTTISAFVDDPAYVTSIHATSAHWRVYGGSSIFKATKKQFRLYLHEGTMTKWANEHKWSVNYVAYDGIVFSWQDLALDVACFSRSY